MRHTSAEAYRKAAPKMGSKRARNYQHILDQQERGATDQELSAALSMSGDTVRPCRLSLLKDNLIYDTGRTRKNGNGNECIVWVVSEIEQLGMF